MRDDADDADDAEGLPLVLPAALAAAVAELAPGPLDAAVTAILWAWVARTRETFGLSPDNAKV